MDTFTKKDSLRPTKINDNEALLSEFEIEFEGIVTLFEKAELLSECTPQNEFCKLLSEIAKYREQIHYYEVSLRNLQKHVSNSMKHKINGRKEPLSELQSYVRSQKDYWRY